MTIRLHSYWRSSAAYRIRIALNLKGLDHEIVPVSLLPGVSEHRGEAYRSKNPQMLVPYFEDGDVAMSQSAAIFEYLEETYPEPPLLPASQLPSAVAAVLASLEAAQHNGEAALQQRLLEAKESRARAEGRRDALLAEVVPLRELVLSDAFTDQHLRVMLRVSEQSTQARDRYGHVTTVSQRVTTVPPPFDQLSQGRPRAAS